MTSPSKWLTAAAVSAAAVTGLSASAASVTAFDFQGKAGSGLLPLNGVGPGTPTAAGQSSATGGELGTGLSYNHEANQLLVTFEFSDLSGGLFDAAGGIHLHLTQPGDEPFLETGPIAFSLNAPDDNVNLFTEAVDFGTESAEVSAVVQFSDQAEQALFDGRYYLNIHSGEFNAGELRANLVPAGGVEAIPTPAAAAMGLVLMTGLMARRRGEEIE
jgi:hypothetical protein